MTICTFCSTKFINNVVLNRHQKTAKYCLKLQGIIESDKKQPEKIFECLDCFTVFKTKQNLNNHLSLCNATKIRMIKDEQIKNLEQEIDRYKKENNELKIKLDIYKSDHDCIQEIAKQPKTINTSNTLNNNKYMYLSPLFLTKENIKDVIETNFTKDNFLNGQKGVAEFTYHNLLLDDNNNPKYICNDPNRHTFTYKNKDGKIEKDYKGSALTNLIFDDVVKKSTVISNNIISNNKEDDFIKNNCLKSMIEIKDLKNNNSEYITRLTKLVKMKENNILIQSESIQDEDNMSLNITYDFMKEQSQFLTQKDILNGVDGLVNYSLRYPFKDRLICSEYTSKILNYKDAENKLITDVGGFQICKQLFKSIENQYRKLYEEYRMYINEECNKYTSKIEYLNTEEEVEKCYKELDLMNEPLERLMEEKYEIYKIFKGEENEYLLTFINKLCLKTLFE